MRDLLIPLFVSWSFLERWGETERNGFVFHVQHYCGFVSKRGGISKALALLSNLIIMKDVITAIALFLGIVLLIGLLGWVGKSGLDQNEVVQCRQWQEQSAQYAGFYLVQWQADQCKAHNIIINAPVK